LVSALGKSSSWICRIGTVFAGGGGHLKARERIKRYLFTGFKPSLTHEKALVA
jgi:hypothetical protein